MFELLLLLTAGVALAGMAVAWDGSGDVFHPLLFMTPMFLFVYGWMPHQLAESGALASYFLDEQLVYVQAANLLGLTAFICGCLAAGVRAGKLATPFALSEAVARRLLLAGSAVGALGLSAWVTLIAKSGGPVQAFSKAYSGGWDDSGYVRDGSILLLAAILLLLPAASCLGSRPRLLLTLFTVPWLVQALLTSRRGPTFALIAVWGLGWYLCRGRRPSLLAAGVAGVAAGYLVLFLVANRSQIYLGSDFEFSTDVTRIVETPDTGNEYIYGAGSLLAAERRGEFFWGRRYLAQVLVRPVPTAIWPNKYEDFGVPELLHNAGTGEGIGDTMGWEGAVGSAPGIVADLWVEGWWLAMPGLGLLGWVYGWVWRKAVTEGGPWAGQFGILAALSIYLVMQTMEAVIFRTLLLSVPLWLSWHWARADDQHANDAGQWPDEPVWEQA